MNFLQNSTNSKMFYNSIVISKNHLESNVLLKIQSMVANSETMNLDKNPKLVDSSDERLVNSELSNPSKIEQAENEFVPGS